MRKALSDPAQKKAGAPDVVFGRQVEEAEEIMFYA